MKSVLLLQFTRLKRAPTLMISFVVLTIVFVAVIGGFGTSTNGKEIVYAYGEGKTADWLDLLNESNVYQFEMITKQEAQEQVKTGKLHYALELQPNNYQFLVGTEDPEQVSVQQYVQNVFQKERQLQQISLTVDDPAAIRDQIEASLDAPVLTVHTEALHETAYTDSSANRYQVMIGMSLYFVIYTIFNNLTNIIMEKRNGTWNRIILSPVRKWQVYMGHLFYCFVLGLMQIGIVFLVFRYLFGYNNEIDFLPTIVTISAYLFAIVSLGMLLLGVASKPQQLQAINPIVATGMAMLGGAFWPLDAVSNGIMIALSKAMPIRYGIEALKSAMLFNQGFEAVLQPIAFLLLFGVICMGIGINLMERVKN